MSEGKGVILEKALRIQMLGGFAIYYGGEAVALKKVGGSKSIRLLQMLLLSLPGGISKVRLWIICTDGMKRQIWKIAIKI